LTLYAPVPIGFVFAGHSFGDIALTDGMMLKLDRLAGVLDVDRSSGLARVQAGITIHELSRQIAAHGLALENLGDIDRQTIAGAISTATHGTGARLRNLSAQVSELTLVLADGSTLVCSAERDPETFRAARVGLGTLGANVAEVLGRLGFRVAGWSRSPKQIDGIECFHGQQQLGPFLQRSDILVCLLPLTPDTRHILNRQLFTKLHRDSPMGAPVLINAGRGGLQNEADILGCLDDGTLGAASLDVFANEPLPADSRFWTHPKIVLTPHNAADTDPDEISKYVARQIERFEAGGALENVVDPARGY